MFTPDLFPIYTNMQHNYVNMRWNHVTRDIIMLDTGLRISMLHVEFYYWHINIVLNIIIIVIIDLAFRGQKYAIQEVQFLLYHH